MAVVRNSLAGAAAAAASDIVAADIAAVVAVAVAPVVAVVQKPGPIRSSGSSPPIWRWGSS